MALQRTNYVSINDSKRRKIDNRDKCNNEMSTDESNNAQKIELKARPYQVRLVEKCEKRNQIVFLQTGAGKTFIAVMLVKKLSDSINYEIGKKTIFLANTVPLVQQQAQVMRDHTPFDVGDYYGDKTIDDKKVDSWNEDIWQKELANNQILVMSPQILVDIIEHAFISFKQVNLIIFDECHHTRGNHPYSQIMRLYKQYKDEESSSAEDLPRILGLTASVVSLKCKKEKFKNLVRELETATLCKVVTASVAYDNETGTNQYVFRPRINVVRIDADFDETLEYIGKIIEHYKNLIDDTGKVYALKTNENNLVDADEISKERNVFKSCVKMMSNLKNCLTELGYYCFYEKFKIVCEILRKIADANLLRNEDFDKQFRECIENMIEDLKEICNDHLDEEVLSSNEARIRYSSPKIQKFLQILKENNKDSDKKFHAIAFVERRDVAFLLKELLCKLAEDEEWSFIKCDYIVGHSMTSSIDSCFMNTKEQQKILTKYRNNELNLLIATNIIEEGVDIPACNMVVRLNVPKNFGSYIQSKGRARAKNSIYYLFIEKDEDLYDIDNFIDIETEIENEIKSNKATMKRNASSFNFIACSNSDNNEDEIDESSSDDDYADDDSELLERVELPSYRKGDAQITYTSAINLINRYCTTLENDGMTLYPKWKMFVHRGESSNLFRASLILPANSNIHEEIIGDLAPRKKYAKMSAALKMCELLDQKGELDDSLIPVARDAWGKTQLDYNIDQEDEEHRLSGATHKIGSTKMKRSYEKTIAKALFNNHPKCNKPVFITKFILKDLESGEELNSELAMVTSKPLDFLPEFRLNNMKYKFMVQAKNALNDPMSLSEDELSKLKEFNEFIFIKLLKIEFKLDFEKSKYGALITLLKNNSSSIDWHRISSFNIKKDMNAFQFYNELGAEMLDGRNFVGRFLGKLVLLRCFHKELTPLSSETTSGNKSYKKYFKERHKIDTICDEQPMIEIEYLESREGLQLSNSDTSVKKQRKGYLLISEHIEMFTVNWETYKLINLMPNVIYRLNCILKANELRNDIQSYIVNNLSIDGNKDFAGEEFSWQKSIKPNKLKIEKPKPVVDEQNEISTDEDAMDVQQIDIENIEVDSNEIMADESKEIQQISDNDDTDEDTDEKMEVDKDDDENKKEIVVPKFTIRKDFDSRNETFPNMYEILQCLTLKNANDFFDLERYEILGDCFLKLMVSLHIYCNFSNKSEGKLTSLKSQRVSNRYLYRLASEKQLANYIIGDYFEPKKNWLPPNYSECSNTANGEEKYKMLSTIRIADKSIADCVEALIGAYLIKCGQKVAKVFMSWLNFVISKDEGIANFNVDYKFPDPNISGIEYKSQNKFKKLEEALGYTFKNDIYLVQAFTHPSFMTKRVTGSYQRLEFIGDAVLDLIVTQHLFNDEREHSPGELTDLRQALVNNRFFAHLAVKHGLDRYLIYENKAVFDEIDNYKKVNSEYTPSNAFFHSNQIFEDDEMTIDDFDAPKCLADIFESVAGALFIDSGCSLETVWNVYYKIFEPYFKLFRENTPKSPIRALLDLEPCAKLTKGEAKEIDDRKVFEVSIKIGEQIFCSHASSKSKAKIKVCKKAIKALAPDQNILFF